MIKYINGNLILDVVFMTKKKNIFNVRITNSNYSFFEEYNLGHVL